MFNRSNFKKLADFLETLHEDQFNMRIFVGNMSLSEEDDYMRTGDHPCGTVACAAGWAPAAGILPETTTTYWSDYIRQVFLNGDPRGIAVHPVYDWVFADQWSRVDNTPKGAIARIRWMLAGNPIDLPKTQETVERYMA